MIHPELLWFIQESFRDSLFSQYLVSKKKNVAYILSSEFPQIYLTHKNPKIALCSVETARKIEGFVSYDPQFWFGSKIPDYFNLIEYFRISSLMLNQLNIRSNLKPELLKHEMLKVPGERVFIRPASSSRKDFDGQVVSKYLIDDFLDAYRDIVDSSLEVYLNPVKEIQQEWRLIINSNGIVTGSEYKRDGKLYQRQGYPSEASYLIEPILPYLYNSYQDFLMVIDICKVVGDSSLKIVEPNSFNTSDFYLSDFDKIIEALETIINEEDRGI